jgi:hypothetical protein
MILTTVHWSSRGNRSAKQKATRQPFSQGSQLDPRLKEPSRSNESLVERRGLRAQESGRNRVVVPQKAKPFQFASMSVYLQNGQEKHQHDRGKDERW